MANARIAKVKSTKKTVNRTEKVFKSIDDFTFEDRIMNLSQLVVHPQVQKRTAGIDSVIGAVPDSVEAIFAKLEDEHLQPADLIKRDPMIVCGVLDDQSIVTQTVIVDGHTRIAALVRYMGISFEMPVKYFEATERELWIASGSINANNAVPLTRNEIKKMIGDYLQDADLVKLSDAALAQLFSGQYAARNIGNLRDALIIRYVIDKVKKVGQDFEKTLRVAIDKYKPAMRMDIYGNEMDTSRIGGDPFQSLYERSDFDEIRPKSEAELAEAEAPAKTDQPAAATTTEQPVAELAETTEADQPVDHTPAPEHTSTFVPADPETTTDLPDYVETDQRQNAYDDQPAYEFSGGELVVFDGIEFTEDRAHDTVEIRTAQGALIVNFAALELLVDHIRQARNGASLFAVDGE